MQVTDEEKKALLGGAGYFNDYVIKFPSVTITNETIHQESVSIKQAITGDGDLEFGGCIASTFEFEVSEVLTEELKGQEFTAELLVNNGNAARAKMGTYIAETVTQVDDNDYKKVVGYDAFYKMQEDITEWYNDYFKKTPETTLGKFVNDLLEYFGVSSVTKSFANDNISISKTVEATNGITGQVLLKMACVLAGGFGVINRDGKFEIIYLDEETLFPEENLYPEETLYPEDSSYEYLGLNDGKEEVSYPEYRTVTYEEYNVQPATCLKLATDKDDVGAVIGDDLSNPFIITGNYFLYGKTTDELKKIGEKIADKILSITYRPCDITADGMIWLDLGSRLALEKKNDDIITYLFSRELKGIQALTDTISAKGTEYRSNEVTANEEILNTLKASDDIYYQFTNEDDIRELIYNMQNNEIKDYATIPFPYGLMAPEIVSYYNHEDIEQIIYMGIPAVRMYLSAFCIMNINILLCNYFQSVGMEKPSILISIIRGFLLNIILVLSLPMVLGGYSLWIIVPITEIITLLGIVKYTKKSNVKILDKIAI